MTREQTAAILNRYVGYKGGDVSDGVALNGCVDIDKVSSWVQQIMQWAVADELVSGTDAKELPPGGTTIRARAAQIFMQLCENVLK